MMVISSSTLRREDFHQIESYSHSERRLRSANDYEKSLHETYRERVHIPFDRFGRLSGEIYRFERELPEKNGLDGIEKVNIRYESADGENLILH